MKTYWKPEQHINKISEVTEKRKKEQESSMWAAHFKEQYFDTKEEAIAWKRNQLQEQIETARHNLKHAENNLKKFDKKFL